MSIICTDTPMREIIYSKLVSWYLHVYKFAYKFLSFGTSAHMNSDEASLHIKIRRLEERQNLVIWVWYVKTIEV